MSNEKSRRDAPLQASATRPGALTMIMEIFGVSRAVTISALAFVGLIVVAAVVFFIETAPPTTITITTGPQGSIFQTNAIQYSMILAEHGVKLKILTSRGSLENLERLNDPSIKVDAGFVLGGVADNSAGKLVSLGSLSYQPLLLFYRGAPIELLSGLAGKRVALGPAGSGTRSLALTLLATNGITSGGTNVLLDMEPQASSKALLEGTLDAVFLMGEDASPAILRQLLRAPNIQLFSFKQAVAYSRRYPYLSVLELPEGTLDFGKDIPARDVYLIGPTVELIARNKLHPALSDLLLEAARKVHGNAGVFQHKDEFPAALEHEFPISSDATRYYKSGKSFFYRHLPFWLASIVSQTLVAFVPMVVVLIPVLRSIPAIYRWRVRARIYRWYRALLALERQLQSEAGPAKRVELLKRLDQIENAVHSMRVPAFAADQFYSLRGHIGFVRELAQPAPAK